MPGGFQFRFGDLVELSIGRKQYRDGLKIGFTLSRDGAELACSNSAPFRLQLILSSSYLGFVSSLSSLLRGCLTGTHDERTLERGFSRSQCLASALLRCRALPHAVTPSTVAFLTEQHRLGLLYLSVLVTLGVLAGAQGHEATWQHPVTPAEMRVVCVADTADPICMDGRFPRRKEARR
eukprot:g57196.t1